MAGNRTAIVCGGGYVYGKEMMSLALADGLRTCGHEVHVITTSSSWSNGDFNTRLDECGIDHRSLRLGFIGASLNRQALGMTLEQLRHWPGLLAEYHTFIRTYSPTRVIHTNWHHATLLSWFLRRDRDIFWLHENIPDRARYRSLFSALAKRLEAFVAISAAVKASLIRLGVADEQIRVIHNGVMDCAPAHPKRGGAASPVRIGIVGQVGRWKGHEDLLEALALLSHAHSDVELIVFGRGTETFESHLRQRVAALGLSARVAWKGFVTKVDEIYSNIDICVVATRSEEPFGLVAVEAALFRVPVVATRKGGLTEIVRDGETGFLCEAGAPPELAAKLDLLCADACLRSRMGGAARRHALTHFSRDRFVREFNELLQRPSLQQCHV